MMSLPFIIYVPTWDDKETASIFMPRLISESASVTALSQASTLLSLYVRFAFFTVFPLSVIKTLTEDVPKSIPAIIR